jgi:glycosyltransferase involved in cell wall biosynthesis
MVNQDLTTTILMAVYNDERFVTQALESIQKQLNDDMELLVIDDDSSDKSLEILQDIEKKDSRVRLIKNDQNKGLGYCLYIGTKMARGKYIIRMDADDICLPNRIDKQISFLEDNPNIDIVGGAAIEIDEQNQEGQTRQMPEQHDKIAKAIWACPIIHPTVAFRRDKILLAGNYNPQIRRRQDYELWFRCLKAGLRFANLAEPLIYYRFSQNSHSKQRLKHTIEQVKMGWQGCWMMKLPLWQYFAVIVPLVRAILPPPLSHWLYRSLAFVDPRKK